MEPNIATSQTVNLKVNIVLETREDGSAMGEAPLEAIASCGYYGDTIAQCTCSPRQRD